MTKIYSEAIEDYLKAIYEIQRRHGNVATTALADWLDISPASVTNMLKKLAEMGLVARKPYKGVSLTEMGHRAALEIIRHHRLLESFLAEKLGVPWDEVHDHAESWEHALSETVEARIDAVLDYPDFNPHGAPIPTLDGSVTYPNVIPLAELQSGESAVVVEVSDQNPELLRYLGQLGLYPNIAVTVLGVAPLNGPLTVLIGDKKHVLGHRVVDQVFVTNPSQVNS